MSYKDTFVYKKMRELEINMNSFRDIEDPKSLLLDYIENLLEEVWDMAISFHDDELDPYRINKYGDYD